MSSTEGANCLAARLLYEPPADLRSSTPTRPVSLHPANLRLSTHPQGEGVWAAFFDHPFPPKTTPNAQIAQAFAQIWGFHLLHWLPAG